MMWLLSLHYVVDASLPVSCEHRKWVESRVWLNVHVIDSLFPITPPLPLLFSLPLFPFPFSATLDLHRSKNLYHESFSKIETKLATFAHYHIKIMWSEFQFSPSIQTSHFLPRSSGLFLTFKPRFNMILLSSLRQFLLFYYLCVVFTQSASQAESSPVYLFLLYSWDQFTHSWKQKSEARTESYCRFRKFPHNPTILIVIVLATITVDAFWRMSIGTMDRIASLLSGNSLNIVVQNVDYYLSLLLLEVLEISFFKQFQTYILNI